MIYPGRDVPCERLALARSWVAKCSSEIRRCTLQRIVRRGTYDDSGKEYSPYVTTSYPVLVNKHLVGDFGILIFVGAVMGAVVVGRIFRSGMNRPQAGVVDGEVAPAAK